MTSDPKFKTDFSLRDQIRRAAVSIMSNIAEGFGRGGDRELIQFLSIAKASTAEVQSQLYVALDTELITESTFQELYKQSLETLLVIGGFMRYLKESKMGGSKFK
jgi:four helix bundle protein